MVEMRASTSSTIGGSKFSDHQRLCDLLSDDSLEFSIHSQTSTISEDGMLPVYFADREDFIQVMLELDKESMKVRSVTPNFASSSAQEAEEASQSSVSSTSSAASRIWRKLAWLAAPSTSKGEAEGAKQQHLSRDARRAAARLARDSLGAQRALRGLRFINGATGSAEWARVEERFAELSRDGLLARNDFGHCIGMGDSKEFAVCVFDALARRRRQCLECITKEELYDFWMQISDKSFDGRLQIFFDMVDTNVDGRITREEVQDLIILSASANKLSKLEEQAGEYASLIMEELDPENMGYIEIWQLEALLLERERYMSYSRASSTSSAGAPSWSQNFSALAAGGGGRKPSKRWWRIRQRWARVSVSIRERWQRTWVLSLWVLTMAALFTWKFKQYGRRRSAFAVMGYCLPVAKGAAETLKLNMALVLLPVCRNTLTLLRSTGARVLVPFDDNICFHKVIAAAIVAGVAVHAGTHLGCDFPRITRASPALYAGIAGDFGAVRPSYGYLLFGVEGVTGITMVVVMAVVFTLATGVFRRRGVKLPPPLDRFTGFNAFWYSHHFLILVYLLLFVHGFFLFLSDKWYQKTAWMYIASPLLLYLGERTLRAFRSKAYAVKILKVTILPGCVLSVIMSKPHVFKYKSGQYIFLKCPAISNFEWHPFSITSAPGDDHLSVHIRTSGDWTQELKCIFTEHYFSSSTPKRGKLNDLVIKGDSKKKRLPKLFVDGPYGAPAQDYTNYDVLLLVGLGIGATPFISILKDLLYNIRLAEDLVDMATDTSQSGDSTNSFSSSLSSSTSKRRAHKTRHAHFHWVTREAGSFEWFKGVMDEVAEMDNKDVIEMHNYLTSVHEERDARTTLISMVQALNHAKNGVDIVSGTRVRTHFSRPNWTQVLAGISNKHPDATVGVFYCGTPVLAKELKRLCHELSHMTSTRFHFHKEHF